ncbi:MAG: S8 family peptidase, partial [Lachnospiraceae bacterium]|nr:S8 family peptidase [Lachnospiraceae bacterium]
YDVVSSYDEIGHGTAMASVAAGSVLDGGRIFRGAAPEAEIVVVKLRQEKQNLRDYYLIAEDAPAYAETDIMLGVKFAESFASTFRRPVVICIGIGANCGNHTIGSSLAQYLNEISAIRSRGVVICAGNEGNAGHHFSAPVPHGRFEDGDAYVDVELRVGEGERGFLLETWGCVPDVLYASVRTPGGEMIPRFRLGMGQSLTYSFIYERTKVTIDSVLVEPSSGNELIVFRFDAPTAGVWTVRIFAAQDGGNGEFHMWLPITQFLSSQTYFLNPSPYVTITDPGIAERPITTSTYDDLNNSFYVNSGRGYLRNGLVKPDLAAPGVNVSTSLGKQTGSSIAAAMAAGGVAQFFQWAVIQQNNPLVESNEIKTYFIRGATRNPDLVYPNKEWGYGRLNVAGTFEALAGV